MGARSQSQSDTFRLYKAEMDIRRARREKVAGTCNRVLRTCRICWYGPECGPFYGVERLSMDEERRCLCECHAVRAP